MNTLSYKTISANSKTVEKKWVLIDAENQVLGRLATAVAFILRGKHKTNFTPHADTGDYVVVINADKIKLTGNKWEDKKYIRHSGYPGGQYIRSANELMARKPEAMVEKAVKGMLPKNRLGADLFRNLHVYAGGEHKHEAQKPTKVEIDSIK
jgi:large subunit ribosomal protein L13